MRKFSPTFRFIFTSLFLFTSLCFAYSDQQTESDLKILLDKMEVEYEEISVMMGTANWNVYANEGSEDQDTPKQRYFELFNNAELNSAIDYWSGHIDDLSDTSLQSRVKVWKKILTGAAVDFNKDIFVLENQLESILANPGESNEGFTVEDLDNMVLDLMKKRNAKAKELGYENYAELHFEINGLGWDWMYDVVDLIDSKTLEPYKKVVAKYKEENGISEFGVQEAFTLAGQVNRLRRFVKVDPDKNDFLMKETMSNIGFNYDEMPIRFVVENIPYGGNGLAIQVPNDFRVVMKEGMPLEVWMHELGHGLHSMFNKNQHPILKGYEWCMGGGCAAFSEGMAETSSEFVRNEKWIKKYAANTDEELKERDNIIKKYAPAYLRQYMINFLFEMEFYKNLDQDPTELRENLYKKYLLLEKPMNLKMHLSESIFYVAYPLYLQNYFLSRMVSQQVHNAIEKKFGEDYVFNNEVADYLIENYYGDGELVDWREKMKNATGKELDIEEYLESIGI